MGNHWHDVMFSLGSIAEHGRKKKRFDFYLAAAVKNSAHDASSPVGQQVSEYGSQYTQQSYVVRDVPPPTHTYTNTHMHIKTHTVSIK